MIKTILKILYVLIPLFIILIFFIDLIYYYSNITFWNLSIFREFIILGIIFLCYQILKQKLHFDEYNIEQNLIALLILLVANYAITILLRTLFEPSYSSGFPPFYKSPSAIVMSTALSFTAAVTLVPAIFILKQLIFYKRKRRTALFFNLFLLSITLNAIAVFIVQEPVGWFRFSPETMPIDISMSLTLVFILLLVFRNEWITYLSRKKKLIYFFAGIPLYLGIASLFDFAYRNTLPAYSLTIAALTYSLWVFLLIYFGLSLLKLLFHLPTARAFDRKIRELNSLYDLGKILNNETRMNKLLPLITRLTAQVLQSNSTWLELYKENDKKFQISSHQNLAEREIQNNPFMAVEGLNKAIIDKREPILISDVSHNRQYRNLLDWKNDARTILGAPLFNNRDKLMGIIYATKSREYTFDIDDVSLLQGFANQASISLENARLLQESIERERLEQELRIARDVQKKLLPQDVPKFKNFELDAFCLTAYEVGGDYYDFFQFSDGKPGLIVGDVSGKGTSAALYMAEFKGIVQTLSQHLETPFSLACAANRIIYHNIERRTFVSAILAKIDPEKKILTLARAGHTPLLHCGDKMRVPQNIMTAGIGIGLESGKIFDEVLEEKTIQIQLDDTLIFYTDGVTEARNAAGEEFGEQRLMDLLGKCNANSVQQIKNYLWNTVVEFCGKTPLHDDLTFVILKCF